MDFSFSYELLLFIALGFFAQLVDGALGMAYGLIATTALLSLGTAPALASASVHAAEVVTTGLAGASHAWHRNIDWALFRRLAPAGVAGGIVGAYILTELPEFWLKVFVTFYLIVMTAMITRRVLVGTGAEQGTTAQRERKLPAAAVGGAGGFLDAVGGGGWGPIVTSTLLSPRRSSASRHRHRIARGVFPHRRDFRDLPAQSRAVEIHTAGARPRHRRRGRRPARRLSQPRLAAARADHRRCIGGRHSERW